MKLSVLSWDRAPFWSKGETKNKKKQQTSRSGSSVQKLKSMCHTFSFNESIQFHMRNQPGSTWTQRGRCHHMSPWSGRSNPNLKTQRIDRYNFMILTLDTEILAIHKRHQKTGGYLKHVSNVTVSCKLMLAVLPINAKYTSTTHGPSRTRMKYRIYFIDSDYR